MEDLSRKAVIVKTCQVFSQEEQIRILTWVFLLIAIARQLSTSVASK